MPNIYLGTGGYEGVPGLAGSLKPILYGYCKSVEPICLDHSIALYQVNDGPIYDVLAVYVNEYPLLQMLDCDDLLSWNPSTADISANGYRVDPSRGIFRIAQPSLGMVTVDCIGSKDAPFYGITGGYHS